jgi:hypothetical protein
MEPGDERDRRVGVIPLTQGLIIQIGRAARNKKLVPATA